uniref:Uncharacterized protein n=1 Tax=Cacopsylla melanoneura TaxID=428564 RepID=A0A8D8S8Z7_9HEMI
MYTFLVNLFYCPYNKKSMYCIRRNIDLPRFSHFWANHSLRTPKKTVVTFGTISNINIIMKNSADHITFKESNNIHLMNFLLPGANLAILYFLFKSTLFSSLNF